MVLAPEYITGKKEQEAESGIYFKKNEEPQSNKGRAKLWCTLCWLWSQPSSLEHKAHEGRELWLFCSLPSPHPRADLGLGRHLDICGRKEWVVPIYGLANGSTDSQRQHEVLRNDVLALPSKRAVKCWLNTLDLEDATYFLFKFVITSTFPTPTLRIHHHQGLGLTCPHWLFVV